MVACTGRAARLDGPPADLGTLVPTPRLHCETSRPILSSSAKTFLTVSTPASGMSPQFELARRRAGPAGRRGASPRALALSAHQNGMSSGAGSVFAAGRGAGFAFIATGFGSFDEVAARSSEPNCASSAATSFSSAPPPPGW